MAEKTLVVGMGSTQFRTAQYTSHEVAIDRPQVRFCRYRFCATDELKYRGAVG